VKFVNSNGCVVENINLDFVSAPSLRNSNYGIYFYRCSNVTLNNTCVKNTSGAGVLFLECIKPKVYNLVVENTLADGLHFANCEKPVFDLITTNNTGDDGVALVNYGSALNYTGGEGTRIFVKNSAARGIAVVGQSNVNIEKFTVDDTSSGGIYIAQEGAYNTRVPDNVRFIDGVINNAGCYGVGVGNRFGISYNNTGYVYLKGIQVNGAYSRGFQGYLLVLLMLKILK
jgi:polygalacturonase